MNAKGYFEELQQESCKHPPERLYMWFAYDGTECVGCSECGAVLQGGAILPPVKVKAVKFELYRAEGPSAECGPAEPVTTWATADNILRNWARTAPGPKKGYDKCDFTVTYEDGETYTGRYDLKRHDMGFTDLLAYHIRGFVEFSAGVCKPDHMTEGQYREYLQNVPTDEYQAFLDRYEIGNEQSANEPVLEVVYDPEPEQPKRTYIKTNESELPTGKPIQMRDFGHPWNSDRYNADIWPKQAIRLFGSYKNVTNGPAEFDITFKIGDRAEYDSYNLKYIGEIVNIGPKTVTIKHDGYSDRKSRLSIVDFAWRNWDYDAEIIAREHANWYD